MQKKKEKGVVKSGGKRPQVLLKGEGERNEPDKKVTQGKRGQLTGPTVQVKPKMGRILFARIGKVSCGFKELTKSRLGVEDKGAQRGVEEERM